MYFSSFEKKYDVIFSTMWIKYWLSNVLVTLSEKRNEDIFHISGCEKYQKKKKMFKYIAEKYT